MLAIASPKVQAPDNPMIPSSSNTQDEGVEEEEDLNWSDEKQRILEKYIIDHELNYLGGQRDISQFYSGLNWDRIIQLIGINDLEFLKIKIDDIYENYFMILYGDNNEIDLGGFLTAWKYQDSKILQDVLEMIDNANLQEFKIEALPTTPPPPPEEPHLLDGLSLLEQHHPTNVEITNFPLQLHQQLGAAPVSTVNSSAIVSPVSHSSRHDSVIPELSKTQRRLSLDLMHAGPSDRSNATKKPAETAVTNVNVTTKVEITLQARDIPEQELEQQRKKYKFKDILKRLGLSKKQQSKPKIAPTIPDTTHHPRYSLATEFQPSRRLSLVGENLPIYIRKQIHIPPVPLRSDSPSKRQILVINESTTPTSGSLPRLSRRPSRIQNIVINSQSLYAYNRDLMMFREAPMQEATATDTSGLTTNQQQRLHYDFDDEDENDKEYISPDLLTKYYGMQLEGEDGVDEDDLNVDDNNELEEDNDFVDVHGSFDIVNNDADEDDDDYLFKI